MTEKQRYLMNSLLDRLDMKNKYHRTNLVRHLALNKYRSIDEIPTDLMSAVIDNLRGLLAEPRKIGEKENE